MLLTRHLMCLEMMKKEQGYIGTHIESLKKDTNAKFNHMKEKIHLFQAQARLIEVFENELEHRTP